MERDYPGEIPDLKDVLQVDHADDLAAYLTFNYEPGIGTTLNVSTFGEGALARTIYLSSGDITENGTLSSSAIIQHLLEQANPII